MAATLYLLTKSVQPGDVVVNGIHAMLYNDDNGQSAAQTIASACAQLRLDGHAIVGDTYFDTRTATSTYDADGDRAVILPNEVVSTIAP